MSPVTLARNSSKDPRSSGSSLRSRIQIDLITSTLHGSAVKINIKSYMLVVQYTSHNDVFNGWEKNCFDYDINMFFSCFSITAHNGGKLVIII